MKNELERILLDIKDNTLEIETKINYVNRLHQKQIKLYNILYKYLKEVESES